MAQLNTTNGHATWYVLKRQQYLIDGTSSPSSHSFPRPRPSFNPMSNEALNPLLGPIATFTCTLMDRPMMKIEILMW